MADDPGSTASAWTAIKVTEISALGTLAALACGAAYNASLFFSLSPPLFGLLSVHDHINTAISFIPQTLFGLVLWQFLLFLFEEGSRYGVLATLAYYFLAPFPKTRARTTVRLAAANVAMQTTPEERAAKFDKDKPRLMSILIFSVTVLTLLVLCLLFFVRGHLSVLTVIAAMAWWIPFAIFMIIINTPNAPHSVIMLAIMFPLFVGESSILGFLEARTLQERTENKATLALADRRPNTSGLLLRALDGGVLLYDQATRHLSYYPWAKVEQLEIERRD